LRRSKRPSRTVLGFGMTNALAAARDRFTVGERAMRVICAWCQQEGRRALLRVREPLDDPSETHGICERHQQAVFEGLPSASFPSTRWLFIVPSKDKKQYDHMLALLQDVPGATVIVDRRKGDRRRGGAGAGTERRRLERRVRRPQATSLGYALIRFALRRG
jgi:hypothetical protein